MCEGVRNKSFTIAVVATMSAGKSTLLNALLGSRLLPTRNEACTASLCRIVDRDEMPLFRGRKKHNGKWGAWNTLISPEIIRDWNEAAVEEIELEGNITTIANTSNGFRVVLIDTPGPNNATCEDHAKITERIIDQADFSSIVFVINASVAGVEDEWRLLSRLHQRFVGHEDKARIIFVVNKIDLLDGGHNETVVDVVRSCRSHLQHMGFRNPVVIPLCSELAMRIRQTRTDMIRYKKAKSTPTPPNGQNKGIFMSTDTPRSQSKLRRQVESFLSQRQFYRRGLMLSPIVAKALLRFEHRRVDRTARRILVGGKFFKEMDLQCAEKLTGVPILEKILQDDLNSFSNKG